MNRQSTEDFLGSEYTLYDTIKMYTCHCTFVQTHRMYTTKSESNIYYKLWVIMRCQCRFIICDKGTTVVQDVDSGGRGYKGTLCTFCSFCITLKLD